MYGHKHHRTGASAISPFPGSPYGSLYATAIAGMSAFGHRITGAVRRAARSFWAAYRERTAAKTLSALDDSTLKDIGIHRSQIPYLANRHAHADGVDYRDLLMGR